MGKILVVDDESDITYLLQKGLARNGFEVDVYNEPVKASEEFRPGTYDLALVDIRMPKMNGFELFQELRKKDDKIKVCFLTAFDIYFSEFKKTFDSIDARCFIRKPTTIKDLVLHIKSTLGTT